ncbi:MAG: hypothetical protein GY795_12350 [Desulfobacterales bacterium]|nr:hypothetical protein [Desulfobacterales bacterium]
MGLKDKLKILSEKDKQNFDLLNAKNSFISQVNQLYSKIINEWFNEYFDEGYMSFKFEQINLIEDQTEKYEINQLDIYLEKGPVIVFEPVGTNIIGADGKIDLYLHGKKADKYILLLLQNEQKEYYWELWKSRRKKDQYFFDKKFFEVIIENWLEDWIIM